MQLVWGHVQPDCRSKSRDLGNQLSSNLLPASTPRWYPRGPGCQMGKIKPAESGGEFLGFDYICSQTEDLATTRRCPYDWPSFVHNPAKILPGLLSVLLTPRSVTVATAGIWLPRQTVATYFHLPFALSQFTRIADHLLVPID